MNYELRILDNLSAQAKTFRILALKTRGDPSGKNVHHLRITVRRIRAALWLIEHGSPSLKFRKLKVWLRKIGHALGILRELDVAIEDAKKYHIKTNGLRKIRESALADLKKRKTIKQIQNISSGLDKVLVKLSKHRELNINSGFSLLQKRILPWTQRSLKTNDDYHAFRIVIKKTRYSLEIIGKPTLPLRDLQDVIGKGHDLEVLQEFLGESPRLKHEMRKKYKKARRLALPAVRFAINNLKLV